jgi:hypothetical protein
MRYVPLDYVQQTTVSNIPKKQPAQEKTGQAENIFTGRIESIKRYMKSSPPKWEHAMVTVAADSGEKTIVYVIKATLVTDALGKDLSTGGKFGVFSLKNDECIEVKYLTVKKDHNEAILIHRLD